MNKKIKYALAAVGITLVLLAAAALSGYYYVRWYVTERVIPITDQPMEVVVQIDKGASVKQVIAELQSKGLEINPDITQRAFQYFKADKNIHAGRYRLGGNWTLKQVIEHLASGNVIMSKFTLVEGTETDKFLQKVFQNPDLEQPTSVPSASEVMALIGAPKDTHPEGQFAADTFVFAAGSPSMAVIKQAYQMQQRRLKEIWEGRDPDIAVKTPYELLILASLIEKETGNAEDRNLVSSVFNNRLKKGMLLQTDPTVIYGVKDFNGKILKSHLKADHPYNTYVHAGLPPTPIANPGLASLKAAAHPEKSDYLYFVAMGDGKSYFSKTLKEHNQAVQKYLRSQGK